jgi:hypothetical protein
MEQPELNPRNMSQSIDATAVRWGSAKPEDDPEIAAPFSPPEGDGIVPNRHSASAEAASMRWQEQHPEDA